MQEFLNAESVMLVLFFCVAVGFWLRKVKIMDDHFEAVMSKIIMTVTCPAIVIDSVLRNTNLPDNNMILLILGASLVMFIPFTIVSWVVPLLYPIPRNERGGHAYTICFSNVGFLGFAVVSSILGPESVLYVAIYNLVTNIWMYTFGAHMIATTGPEAVDFKQLFNYMKENLLSPIVAACFIALVLALFHVNDSGVIGQTFQMLGSMTAPAVMLVIGSKMACYEIREMINNPWAYVTVFVRLIVIPAIAYLVGMWIIGDSYIVASITIVVAMPAAMVGTVMCILYGGNVKPLNQGMFLSVLFSLVTIPLVAVFIA